jgi:hypothetical protein
MPLLIGANLLAHKASYICFDEDSLLFIWVGYWHHISHYSLFSKPLVTLCATGKIAYISQKGKVLIGLIYYFIGLVHHGPQGLCIGW